ncbi:MAG TPA: DUF4350 domain-containing protein [Candidatus Cybelea sp.]|nr:DUF4350 domain-containing protein [Candidatus Cybelea sp.]
MTVTHPPAPGRSRLKALRGTSAGPFPLITLILLIVIGVGSFVAASYLEIFNDGSGEPWTTGRSTFSRSAIGHRAFAATLRKLGIPVEISRFQTLDKVGTGNLLLAIEPDLDETGKTLLTRLSSTSHALLVLPKWEGRTDFKKPIWIDKMKLFSSETPLKVLDIVAVAAKIDRSDGTITYRSARFDGKLQIDSPQFFSSPGFTPLIQTPQGTLLGAVNDSRHQLWVLSDPDLLSNAGLDEADNGIVAINIIRALLPRGGTVIIDETAHGYEQRPNLLRVLLHPPFVIVSVSTIVVLLALIWAGITRFGAPLRESDGLAAGKLTLVRNTAQLLRLGTTAASLLQNYRRLTLSDAIAELHGPAGLDEFKQAAWLDRAAQHRGLAVRVTPILDQMTALGEANRLDGTRALRLALDLHRWKQEIMHGTVTASRRHGGSSTGGGGTGGAGRESGTGGAPSGG